MSLDKIRVQIQQEDGAVTLRLSGELDYSASARLRQTFAALLSGEPERMTVDLRQLVYLDSSGLNDLLYCYKTTEKVGCALELLVDEKRPARTSHMRQIMAFLPIKTVTEPIKA